MKSDRKYTNKPRKLDQILTAGVSIHFYHFIAISLHLVASRVKVIKRLNLLILKGDHGF